MATETLAMTREIDGRTVPAAGTWTIDPAHTQAEFVARHLMVTKVRGGFERLSGVIEVAEDVADSSVVVAIETASVTTGAADRDAHLTSADFFDVEQYPEIRFTSTSVEPAGDGWKLHGDLTIKDVTKPVVLDFSFLGITADPWGGTRAAFSGSTEIEREAWGLSWNVALEGGGVLVSKTVKLDIEVQATRS